MKKYHPYIVFCLLLFSLLFSFGEQPLKENNIAAKAVVINPTNKPDLKKINDGDIYNQQNFNSIILDLNKLNYLNKLEIFKPENIENIGLSEDIVNWQSISPNVQGKEKLEYLLDGKAGRYIRLTAKDSDKEARCSEIAIYPLTDYKLQFEDISASSDITSCVIHIRTSVATLVQTIYGYNYDFIYNKKLDFSISTLSPGKDHYIKITDLLPSTTYRYQIKVTDFNDKTIYSNFFTFTTKNKQE